jgi:shikimate dehydrogenase
MLVWQGALAFELWTGQQPPVEVMYQAARQTLGA